MSKLVPKLRFKEFSGEWEDKRLNNVCDINPKIDSLPNNFIYIDLESVVAGKLLQENEIQKENSPSRAQRLLKKGDVIYQMVRPYQKNNLFFNFENNKDYVASTGYAQLRAFNSNSFLYQLVHIDTFVNEVLENSTGSNYPAINSKDLAKITVIIPKSPKEQQKIASTLSSLDNLIEAQNKKVEALKKHKKGLMQQLFPKEGEKVPTLRFDGFFGEWEEKRLGEICSTARSGGTPKSTNKSYYNGNIPFLSIMDMTKQGKYLTYTAKSITKIGLKNSASWIVPVNTIIYSMYASVGFVAINKIPLATSQAVINLILKEDYITEYIYYFLINYKQYIHKLIETGTQGNLNAQSVKSLIILLPTPKEQQKIASCLSSLDSLIEVNEKKVEALKKHKKGLMQQMFVSGEV